MSDKLVFRYSVTPCQCGSRSFEPADPLRCIECGLLPDEVKKRELPENAVVEFEVIL